METSAGVLLSVLLFVVLLKGCTCVRITEVKVPNKVKAHETVTLTCNFDLENKVLYSLNWWKGTQQFYIYTASSNSGPPQQTIYNTSGIHVDKSLSGLNEVVLRNVTRKTSGWFKCEVVAEFPSYERDSKIATMEVIEVPNRPPVLSLRSLQYQVGDVMDANCSSQGTQPPSTIIWLINGQKIHPQHYRVLSPPPYAEAWFEDFSGGRNGIINVGKMSDLYDAPLTPIRSNVNFVLRHNHFVNGGRATLTCVALFPGLYRKSRVAHITLPGVAPMTSFHRISKGSEHRLSLAMATSTVVICCVGITGIFLRDFTPVYSNPAQGL